MFDGQMEFVRKEFRQRLQIATVWGLFVFSLSASFLWVGEHFGLPGVTTIGFRNGLLMFGGSAIVPVIFFLTRGLAGYRQCFANLIAFLRGGKVRQSDQALIEQFGSDAISLTSSVDIAEEILGILLLEVIIVGFDVALACYGGITGLGFVSFLADNTTIALYVTTLELVRAVLKGLGAYNKVYVSAKKSGEKNLELQDQATESTDQG